MADVDAFQPLRHVRPGKGFRQRGKALLHGQFAREAQPEAQARVFLRQFQPFAPRLARFRIERHLAPAFLAEPGGNRLAPFQRMTNHQLRRRVALMIKLRNKGGEHLRLRRLLRQAWEKRLRTHAMPVAVKQYLHTGLAVSGCHRQHIRIRLARDHMLFLRNLAQLHQLIAQQRRLLIRARLRRRFHLRGQLLQQHLAAAIQKIAGMGDRLRIRLLINKPHTRRIAALNLILQTGTAARGKKAVLALAHAEYLGEYLQRIARRLHIGKRAEKLALLARAAMQRQARKRMRRQHDIRIGLVITQQNIELRQMRFDEIVLQNQRFRFRMGNRRINIDHLPHQGARLGAHAAVAEITGQAVAQILRLADIKHLALGIAHLINPRQRCHMTQKRLRVELPGLLLAHKN